MQFVIKIFPFPVNTKKKHITNTLREPSNELGKPKPLQALLKGAWSFMKQRHRSVLFRVNHENK